MEFKQCTKCYVIKFINMYKTINRKGVTYHVGQCKDCERESNRNRERLQKEKREETGIRFFQPTTNDKVCTKCQQIKNIQDFWYRLKRDYYVYNSECKECEKIYNRDIHHPRYYQEHKEEIKKKVKEWAQNNREHVNEYHLNRYHNNPKIKLQHHLQSGLLRALKEKKESQTLLKYLGCSIDQFYNWIEFQFYDGMSWENQGSYWHLDHTIPISAFDFEDEQIKKCFNWVNLRPLKAYKNLSKGNKINIREYLFQQIKGNYFTKNLANATPSNCGKLLKSLTTTSSEKSFEGTQVMTDLYGKNVKEYMDNPQPSSCVHYDKNMEKVQRLYGGGLDESNQFKW